MPRKRTKKSAVVDPTADVEIERVPNDFDKYINAAGEIKGWKPAADVFDRVTSVRTIFPDFNRATRVGGLPVRRIHTLHGPTHGGKTAFALGLVKSFVDMGYLSGYIDAEHTLGKEFVAELVADLEGRRNFLADRPLSYEKTIEKVDEFLGISAGICEKHPDHKSILVVDSINKLTPERELKNALKGDGDDEGGGGRGKTKGSGNLTKGHGGRYRAAVNQAWLDHLTPRLAAAQCALVLIAQERDDEDTSTFIKTDDFKVKGGKALLFDASLVIRVSKSSPITRNPSDKKSNENIVGFGHRVRVWKSKVGHMDGRYTDCAFHLSNGKLSAAGFDMARDAVLVGANLGIVKQSGAWFSYKGRRQQGVNSAIGYLNKNPDRLTELMLDIGHEIDKREGRIGA